MHIVKFSEHFGGDPCVRVYEQKIASLADLRELIRHLEVLLQKCNREGRELVVEAWSDHDERVQENMRMIRKNQATNCT